MKTLSKTLILSCISAGLAVDKGLHLPCRGESTVINPNPCFPHENDCCIGLTCLPEGSNPSIHTCQTSVAVDVSTSHVIVNHASAFAETLTSLLDNASAKVAAADKELESMQIKASKDWDNLKESVAEATENAQKDLSELQANATETARAELEEKAKEATKIALQKADLVKKKADELFEQVKQEWNVTTTVSSINNSKETKNSKSTDSSTGMDWNTYIPGGNSDKKKSHSDKTGGMDWSQFTPGSNTKKDSKDKSTIGTTGFKWDKFMPGTSNQIEMDSASGSFDWHSFAPKMKNNNAPVTNNAATVPSNEGELNGPCGKTNFKRFKDCVDGLQCQAPPATAMGWAPGKCVSKSSKDDKSSSSNQQSSPGELGGPCGATSFMDFGVCDKPYVCSKTEKEGFVPGKCVVQGESTVSTETINNAFTGVDGGFDISKWDGLPGMKSTVSMLLTKMDDMDESNALVFANHAADTADAAAAEAEKAAELLSKYLKKSAEKLRDSASKLRNKASSIASDAAKKVGTTPETSNTAEIQAVSQTEAVETGSSWYVAFIGGALIVSGVVFYNKSKRNAYQPIPGNGNDWGSAF